MEGKRLQIRNLGPVVAAVATLDAFPRYSEETFAVQVAGEYEQSRFLVPTSFAGNL
jgi:hypothetical protein